MTYNVRYFAHATRGLLSTRGAMRRIARAIATLHPVPDIVCLQEVETESLRSNLAGGRASHERTQLDAFMFDLSAALLEHGRSDEFAAYYFPAHRYRVTAATDFYTTGLAIIARRSFRFLHSNAHQPHEISHRKTRLKQTRICAHGRIETPTGFVLDIFNTHLSLPSFLHKTFWTEEARMGFGPNQLDEVDRLAAFVHTHAQSDHVMVLGDFNALPGSPVDTRLQERLGMRDAFVNHGGLSSSEAREFPTAGFLNLRMHLDHVYASPAIRWLDFDGTHAYGRPGAFAGLSDHVPIMGRIRVEAPAA